MTNYVPRHAKKRERLHSLECDLFDAMSKRTDRDKILRLLAEIREAKIRVFRAQRAQIPPRDGPGSERFPGIDARIQEWQSKPIEEIEAHYRRKFEL